MLPPSASHRIHNPSGASNWKPEQLTIDGLILASQPSILIADDDNDGKEDVDQPDADEINAED